MADLVVEPVAWEEYHRALQQVDDARAELALVLREKEQLGQAACGFAFEVGRYSGQVEHALQQMARMLLRVSEDPFAKHLDISDELWSFLDRWIPR